MSPTIRWLYGREVVGVTNGKGSINAQTDSVSRAYCVDKCVASIASRLNHNNRCRICSRYQSLLQHQNAKLSGPVDIVSEPWVGSGRPASSRMQAMPGAGDGVGVVGRDNGNVEEA